MERVNHPQHYQGGNGIETIDVIRHYTCDIANALKYLMRAGHKPEHGMTDEEKEVEDLEKALWYIEDYATNCSDETCADAARPYMRSLVRMATGHSVKEICDDYHRDIAKAIELLLMVGLVRANGIVRVNHWEQYLAAATKCIQQRILDIETALTEKELESTAQVLHGQAVDGEDYISKPACRRETEPDHYDPLNVIIAFGTAYCLSSEVRKRDNGSLHTPCENCALMDVCYPDWRHPDESQCRHLCLLHQAETNEYYREVGRARYAPAFGTIEVVDELKESELELKRIKEEIMED